MGELFTFKTMHISHMVQWNSCLTNINSPYHAIRCLRKRIEFKRYKLIELCVDNYETKDGMINQLNVMKNYFVITPTLSIIRTNYFIVLWENQQTKMEHSDKWTIYIWTLFPHGFLVTKEIQVKENPHHFIICIQYI